MAASLSCLATVSFLMELELGVQMGPGAAVSPTGMSGKAGWGAVLQRSVAWAALMTSSCW